MLEQMVPELTKEDFLTVEKLREEYIFQFDPRQLEDILSKTEGRLERMALKLAIEDYAKVIKKLGHEP